MLSIAASVLANGSRVTLLYGNRRTNTVMFADEVADLKDAHPPAMQLVHVLSREPQEVELFSGRLDADKLRALLPVRHRSGGASTTGGCAARSAWSPTPSTCSPSSASTADRVHRELFYVEDAPPEQDRHSRPPPTGGSQVTVVLDGRSTTATVQRDTAVLDGAQRVRPDLPFACKGGVCGTCRAKVVRGEVHMRRNYALEDDEVEDGFVLTCQSLPVTDEVTVDYDA